LKATLRGILFRVVGEKVLVHSNKWEGLESRPGSRRKLVELHQKFRRGGSRTHNELRT